MQRKFKVGAMLIAVIALMYVLQWHGQNARVVEAYNADNLIRFHVIANSDTEADQALKLKVRDKVVQAMTPAFSQVDGIEEARLVVLEKKDMIKEIALEEIRNEGKDYPVSVNLGNYMFPTKSYGNLTLPAGKYEAVRVVIGEGNGANWWCVLFPPLCFVDLSADQDGEFRVDEKTGIMDVEDISVQKDLKSGEEIKPSEPQIKVKFKVAEVFEDSVTRVARVLGKHLALKEQE
ncbi:stage II sporulation protein R [Desulfolucanica intricata]|uniref:stage II sporulation protein R n=1 Tax=Desulfolucanica intricata TaxID=1285191 RepID=UPI00082F06B8|nr:stage II sporulation protein R [Desulfolucanica intricata]